MFLTGHIVSSPLVGVACVVLGAIGFRPAGVETTVGAAAPAVVKTVLGLSCTAVEGSWILPPLTRAAGNK